MPVIASTHWAASPELIRDGVDGLLFDPADPGAPDRVSSPGCSTSRACAPALDAAAPQPRSIDDEVDALIALYARWGAPA